MTRTIRRSLTFDCSKAISALGLPQSPIREALSNAVTWFQDRGLLRRRIIVNRR